MKNTFSIQRLGFLLQRYFVLRKRWEVIYWSIITLIIMFIRFDGMLLGLTFTISGIFYISLLPKEMHNRTNGMNYLLIPASSFEKLMSFLIIGILYYLIVFFASYVIGNLLGVLLSSLINMEAIPLTWELFNPSGKILSLPQGISIEYPANYLYNIFISFLVSQCVFLLGGLYFKKNAFAKTVLTLTILFVILLLTVVGITFIQFHILDADAGLLKIKGTGLSGHFAWISHAFNLVSAFTLLLIGYYRITEKEI